jgi:hypothetical protein
VDTIADIIAHRAFWIAAGLFLISFACWAMRGVTITSGQERVELFDIHRVQGSLATASDLALTSDTPTFRPGLSSGTLRATGGNKTPIEVVAVTHTVTFLPFPWHSN